MITFLDNYVYRNIQFALTNHNIFCFLKTLFLIFKIMIVWSMKTKLLAILYLIIVMNFRRTFKYSNGVQPGTLRHATSRAVVSPVSRIICSGPDSALWKIKNPQLESSLDSGTNPWECRASSSQIHDNFIWNDKWTLKVKTYFKHHQRHRKHNGQFIDSASESASVLFDCLGRPRPIIIYTVLCMLSNILTF